MGMHRRVVLVSFLLIGAMALSGCSGEIVVGAVVSQSGSLDSYGARVKNALDLAVEEINAAGGIKGGQIRLVYKDDATNAEMGRRVTTELIEEEGVKVIIGGISSRVAMAMAPICEQHRVVMFSPAASTPALTEAGLYVFRNYPSDVLEGTAMAKFAKDLGLERMIVFALDDDWGHGLESVFAEQYVGSSKFREVVQTFRWADGDISGFAAMAEKAKELAPDGIYIASYVDDLGALLQALSDAGVDAVTMGSSSVTHNELIAAAGPATDNLVYPQPVFDVDSAEPEVSSFVSAYRAKFNEDPDIWAAHAYDAMKILAKAIEAGGTYHADSVKDALAGVNNYEGAAGRTDFDSNGDVVRYPRILIIREGDVMPYENFVEQGGSLLTGS